jgi:perosamine synthetase
MATTTEVINDIIKFIREVHKAPTGPILLHEPRFIGNETKYLKECIDSTMVSSVGGFVDRFEVEVASFTGSKYAIATVNGTAALHIALLMAGVERDDEIIVQPLTFIATLNAISYIGAHPVFIDVDKDTMSLSPDKLEAFLQKNTEIVNGTCANKVTKKKIKAVLPMHTFGLPGRIEQIASICSKYQITLIEDAAESLGSFYAGKHTGRFGLMGTLSFNGNKTITTGGGGMVITDDEILAKKLKHITTTARMPHKWEFKHDMVGYNYRLPNINAALGCAQMENLQGFIENKRQLAKKYEAFFNKIGVKFNKELNNSQSNYWLNSIVLDKLSERNAFLEITNSNGIMTRPLWELMTRLEMFRDCQKGNMDNAEWLADRVVNIPSSVVL